MQNTTTMQITSELKKRVLTGLVGAAALLSLILFGGTIGIFILTTIISLGMVFEYCGITLSMTDRNEKKYFLLLLAWVINFVNLMISNFEGPMLVMAFLSLFTYYLLTARRHDSSLLASHLKELMSSLFGVVYLVLIPLYLVKIYGSINGIQWTFFFLFINWSVDIAAYFVGKKWGRHKLYPEISPKKSVEGALGGLLTSVITAFLCKMLFFKSLPWVGVYLVPILIGVVAQLGDFCESFLKRAFDKKDAGSILPGHGGFLDRFDGVVFSLPLMYACVRVLNP
jgi:phosphatidate cytidylyltransferase